MANITSAATKREMPPAKPCPVTPRRIQPPSASARHARNWLVDRPAQSRHWGSPLPMPSLLRRSSASARPAETQRRIPSELQRRRIRPLGAGSPSCNAKHPALHFWVSAAWLRAVDRTCLWMASERKGQVLILRIDLQRRAPSWKPSTSDSLGWSCRARRTLLRLLGFGHLRYQWSGTWHIGRSWS